MSTTEAAERRFSIIAAARGWINTPYHHQASVKDVGTDCLGLLRGVWREVIGPEPAIAPAYSRDWAEARGAETLLDACRSFLIEIPIDAASAGDVLVFRMFPRAVAKHCAILSGDGCIIHARERIAVLEEPLDGFVKALRRSRIAGAFAFPGTVSCASPEA